MNKGCRNLLRGGVVVMVVVQALSHAAAVADQNGYVNVRLPSQFAPGVTKLIAEAGEPETLLLQRDQSLLDAVVARCNATDPYYLHMLLSLNPELQGVNLSALPKPSRVTFPACPSFPSTDTTRIRIPNNETYWAMTRAANVPLKAVEWNRADLPEFRDIEILEGHRLAEAISKKGTNPNDASFAYFSTLNSLAAAKANPDIPDLGLLKSGQTINALFPKSEWSTIRLKPGIDAAALADKLKAAMREDNNSWRKSYTGVYGNTTPSTVDVGDFEAASDARLITSVQSSLEATACNGTNSEKDWSDIRSLLRRIEAVNANYEKKPIRDADILIVDSGINASWLSKSPFTVDRLLSVRWRDVEASRLSAYARGQTYGVNLAAGVAETLRNQPDTIQGFIDAWHGLSVANVALFGFDSSEVKAASGQVPPATIFRLAFANVVDPTQKDIPPSVLPEALAYAERNSLPIVNMSLAANNSGAPWVDALHKNDGRTLLVVAAGNEHENLEQVGVWPARYGGDPTHARGGRVITVGAYDGNRQLASFSNFGKTYVDLLAPGCDIPTLRSEEGASSSVPPKLATFKASGTSFAAPLVSNLAARLWAYGLSTDEIKARLLVSVNPSFELNDTVYSGGTLNAAKTLSLWTDAVEIQGDHGTEVKFGKLDIRSLKIEACGEVPRSIALRKLSVVYDKASGKRYMRYIEAQPTTVDRLLMTRSDLCENYTIVPELINFFDEETGKIEKISTTKLVDFVAAEFPK